MLRKKWFFSIIMLAAYISICLFYSLHRSAKDNEILKNFADFITPHAWQLDIDNVEKVVENLFRSVPVYKVIIYDEYDKVFYEKAKSLNFFEKILLKLNLFQIKKYIYELNIYGKNFGRIEFYILRKDIYFFTYVLIVFVLLYYAILAYLNLKVVKDKLEVVNRELEDTVNELESTIEELEETQEQLINSEKLASIGRFVAGIAHDLNTPLGIIYTGTTELKKGLEMLEESYKNGAISKALFEKFLEDSNELLALLEKNTKRLVELVKGLKNISSQEDTNKPYKFNLKELINDVVMALNPKIRKLPIDIIIECPEKLEIVSYPSIISQVLVNLIENSIFHGFENGSRKGTIKIKVEDKNDKLIIIYEDDGVGMDDDTKRKVFEPFYSTKHQHGGTGLGLYIVYTLVVEKLMGDVTLESSPGKGVKFTLTIPKKTEG